MTDDESLANENQQSCTFCDGRVAMTVHVVDGGDRHELEVCGDHWEDYAEAVGR